MECGLEWSLFLLIMESFGFWKELTIRAGKTTVNGWKDVCCRVARVLLAEELIATMFCGDSVKLHSEVNFKRRQRHLFTSTYNHTEPSGSQCNWVSSS